MFSFHKPKVFRSPHGCCICKAKSSSSRFTDSKKYENDFIKCFQLNESRQGEICNACVLLVKRFKRLPPDSDRHWSHVVDARIGPGMKSMTKCKKRKEELVQNGTTKFSGQPGANTQNIRNNERFRKICKKNKSKTNVLKNKTNLCDENSAPTSPSSNSDTDRMSDGTIDIDGNLDIFKSSSAILRSRRKASKPQKNRKISSMTMIDMNFWTCVKTCCGIIYENRDCSAVLIDFNQYSTSSCPEHDNKTKFIVCPKEDLSSVIKSLPPKKQHIHRHSLMESASIEATMQTVPIDYSIPAVSNSSITVTYPKQHLTNVAFDVHTSNNVMNKATLNSSKVFKKSITRVVPKRGTADINVMKNLVKLCTDKRIVSHAVVNGLDADTATTEPIIINKYNDNSSDSGYDETLNDINQLNRSVMALNGQRGNVIRSSNLAVENHCTMDKANMKGVQQKKLQAKRLQSNPAIYESQIQKQVIDIKTSIHAGNAVIAAGINKN